MKKLIFIFFLTQIAVFGQDFKMPEINFQNESDKQNIYVAFLNLDDAESLILKSCTASYWFEGSKSKFIVYQHDGKILKFETFELFDQSKKVRIKKKRVKGKYLKSHRDFILQFIESNQLDIDKSKLNITEKPAENNCTEFMIISDGVNEIFEIAQGNKHSAFSTANASIYIKAKYPGYEERQKLLDVISKFENIFNQ